MRIGASIWPFRWDVPYEKMIPRIAGLGYKAVELIAWNRETLDEYYTPQRVKELKKIISDEGLVLSQFVSTPRGMASPDKQVRERAVEHFKKLVETGVNLGAQLVNSVSDYPFAIAFPRITDRPHVQKFTVETPSTCPDAWSKNWNDYVDVMRRCVALCEDAGLRYALEPHPYRYMCNAASMLRLIEQVDSEALGMNLDPSHLFPVGELPHVVIYQLGDRIFHAHFSDNDGVTNVHWRPGKGKIDWFAIMKALKDVNFDGVVSMELEDVPGVSRGAADVPGVYKGNIDATEEFDIENKKAIDYIRGICEQLGIELD